MKLAIVTPTVGRWWWLKQQAAALAPQMQDGDVWIVAVDNVEADNEAVKQITELVGFERMIWLTLNYACGGHPVGCVNRARNAATAMAPLDCDIVEADDHDILEPDALARIRDALAFGNVAVADYVFASFHQQAVIDTPGGRQLLEPWPDVVHDYKPYSFCRRDIEAIGVRAFRRYLWDRLGGWNQDTWPCGDYDFAQRVECGDYRIACLPEPLCTVTIEPLSLSAIYRGQSPEVAAQPPADATCETAA